ncbi:IDEAL domain-containing protein [Bacillus suaedaesalsae]|uniref:IDEAL domain-containing protein n=1 Tax=Bacillus suaedaesalsae TaxID=2810349 RepID=A0ABS2DGQ7_9BACI|nr:IDEAL domain-containing protein [Bacillus suaedaesalsae]MBM6617657.1 IDEAL domain-containing protein [Bacillus suaedaesalsae]
MNQYEKDQKNELMIVPASNETQTEYSLAAQVFLDQSLLMFQQEQLMKKIDESLLNGDRDTFLHLSKQYKELLN